MLLNITSKETYFIDNPHLSDYNLHQKEIAKLLIYYALGQEYNQIHTLNSINIIPVVISVSGLVCPYDLCCVVPINNYVY